MGSSQAFPGKGELILKESGLGLMVEWKSVQWCYLFLQMDFVWIMPSATPVLVVFIKETQKGYN